MTDEEFDRLYRTHRGALRRLAMRLTRSEEDADDLLSATFERSLLKFDSFRRGSNGRGWLGRIMTRLFIDECRRRRSMVPLEDVELAAQPPQEEPWWWALTDEDVRSALVELPPELRRLVEGHVYDGLTYARLAISVGLCPATVGSRLHRVRRRLRESLLRRHGGAARSYTVENTARC